MNTVITAYRRHGYLHKPVTLSYQMQLTEEGKLDPVVGRQPQIERVTQILGCHTKNNPCLIGEPGVGKTAIAEGLAQRIASGDVPETIEGKKVITLDMGLLVAGAAEGAIDAANILKLALARGLRERYELHYKLHYSDEALECAAKLSHQYISDHFLPDKAIDLVDEAGSRVHLRHSQLPEEAKELGKELRVGGNFKERLRELGGLDAVCDVAINCFGFLKEFLEEHFLDAALKLAKMSKMIESVRVLLKCMKVMENATFLSEQNQKHLLETNLKLKSKGLELSFINLVISCIRTLSELLVKHKSQSSVYGRHRNSTVPENDAHVSHSSKCHTKTMKESQISSTVTAVDEDLNMQK
ncbi:uncharacterized protein LOC131857605 [Cryptomeria japonica]|uniref:uncharacterized protein LOC131857605 n=1 Tax=Cryptomeria japonica TaxID=3369 RepID=UPI0027D9F996|nr:uncharacterized protein LOC131857605 [Cryptomeria japonica]